VPTKRETTQALVHPPGGQVGRLHRRQRFGQWLIDNCRQAQVYAELAGVNNIVIDSTDAYKPCCATWPSRLSLYSGQMCTTSQAIFVPAGGIDTEDGHKTYDEVCADLAAPSTGFLSKPEVAHAVLGAIQSADTLKRIELAEQRQAGQGRAGLQKLDNPNSRRPKCAPRCCWPATPADEAAYMEERFGPISFCRQGGRHGKPPSPCPSVWSAPTAR
jgi:acyl-CoA reductase-like NAD-dependent aldehyde dehydrogenase